MEISHQHLDNNVSPSRDIICFVTALLLALAHWFSGMEELVINASKILEGGIDGGKHGRFIQVVISNNGRWISAIYTSDIQPLVRRKSNETKQ